MSRLLLGSFNVLDFTTFDREAFDKIITKIAHPERNSLMASRFNTDIRNLPDMEQAAELFENIKEKCLSGYSDWIDLEIHVDGLKKFFIYHDANSITLAFTDRGQFTFSFETRDFDMVSTDDTFFGIGKKELRENIGNTATYLNGVNVVSDPNKFLIGFDHKDFNRLGNTIGPLETVDEWLNRVHNNAGSLRAAVQRLVTILVNKSADEDQHGKQPVTVTLPNGKKIVFPNLVDLTPESSRDVYVDDVRMPAETLIKHLRKIAPHLEKIIYNHAAAIMELDNKANVIKHEINVLNEHLINSLNGEVKGSVIVMTGNTPEFKAKDPSTDLWVYCRFLGCIGLIIDGKLTKFDCGLWISDNGERISATFVDSNDHTSYHSTPMIENGKFAKTFLETNEVNRGTVLTAIQEWIMKEAISLNYVK